MPQIAVPRGAPSARTALFAAAAALCAASIPVSAQSVTSETIAQTPGGQRVEVFTIATQGRDALGRTPDERPALAIIAGVQGHHQIGVRVAEAITRNLVSEHADLLAGHTVYVIPRVNPDALRRFAGARQHTALSGRAPAPADADGDRRVDEDPPNDLNNDGFITLMRVPAPNHAFGLEATHIIDPDDPRIVREPKDDERGAATHAILIEGLDDDNDGRFNEDGWGGASGGGVDFDMQFPTHWPEHADGAGDFPLQRAETKAIVDWLQDRGNIAAIIVYGPHDTITSIPKADDYGPDRRVPKGIESGDQSVYELVGEAFKDITGIKKTESSADRAGSLAQWCYADLGVYTFATPVWVRPDLVEAPKDDTSDNADDNAETPAESGDETPDADAKKPETAHEHWLAWIDANDIDGFVEWRSFDHPQLGTVQIGGFKPGVRVNPPADEFAALLDQQTRFAARLLAMLPALEIDEPTIERVGAGVWRVGVTMRNTGQLPTQSAIGVKTRRTPGIVAVVDPQSELDDSAITSGSRVQRIATIEGSGHTERVEWLVAAGDADEIKLEIRSPRFGVRRFTLSTEDDR